jgi:hypothetical protein
MKKHFLLKTFTGLALLAAPMAKAWTYQDGDVLLIFRESGFNDVEFDIGNVGQFLNQSNGYTTAVTGWDPTLVTSTFGSDLTGVSVLLAATSSLTNATRTSWLTSTNAGVLVKDVSPSQWQANLWSTINSVGTRPVTYQVTPTESSAYSIDPGGTDRLASYDYIVSGGGVNANSIPELGGNAAFIVEEQIPGPLAFWQIQPSTALPKPPATYLGSFAVDSTGDLTFTAGPAVPSLAGLTVVGDISTVSFTTSPGATYWLRSTNTLGSPISTWPLISGPIIGDGNTGSFSVTNTDVNEFYGVERSP